MKLAKTLLAVAFPLLLSTGCALDVGSSADGLSVNSDFGLNVCGQSGNPSSNQPTYRWIDDDARWPVETIVAGDLQFTKDELVSYLQTNPGVRADLITAMATVQLNMAVGRIIPTEVVEELEAADGLLMADEDTGTPPPVAIDDFANLTDYKSIFERDCLLNPAEVAQLTPGVVDLRPDLIRETPSITDVRPDIVAE